MKNLSDPLHVALKTAIAEYQEMNERLSPLLAEVAIKKATLLGALGEVVIQFVKEHGQFSVCTPSGKRVRRVDKKWYRSMECSNIATHDGFEDLINAAFGHIKWQELYRPALEALDHKKAVFIFGGGDCAVVLSEELTTLEMESIMRLRRGVFT